MFVIQTAWGEYVRKAQKPFQTHFYTRDIQDARIVLTHDAEDVWDTLFLGETLVPVRMVIERIV